MMAATVIAKLLGMLRSVLQASIYGTTAEANAFVAASKLPLAFFDMLLAAAVLGCFIPVYNSFAGIDDVDRDEKADRFASVFLSFIILLCSILALVGILFADPLVSLIAGNLDFETHRLAVRLTRIMFPLVIFTGAAYTLVGVLQSKGSFIAPAMISAISNAGVVLYLALSGDRLGSFGIYGLAIAYLLSWLLQLLTLVVPLWRRGFKFRLSLDHKNPALRRAVKMAPPIIAGSWLSPAGVLLGQYFASRVALSTDVSGATTIFDYANNIYVIIAGTLTYSICNYTFPKISRLAAEQNPEGFAACVRDGLRSALMIVIPFAAAALILAGEGVSIVYTRGAFTPDDARATAAALRPMLAVMPLFVVNELLSRVFYSQNLVRIPMYAALCGIIANFCVGLALIQAGVLGIAAVGAANAAGQVVSALVLLGFAAVRIKGLLSRGLALDIVKLLCGGAMVFALCFVISRLLGGDPYASGLIENIIRAVIIFLPPAAIYLIYAKIIKIRFGK